MIVRQNRHKEKKEDDGKTRQLKALGAVLNRILNPGTDALLPGYAESIRLIKNQTFSKMQER